MTRDLAVARFAVAAVERREEGPERGTSVGVDSNSFSFMSCSNEVSPVACSARGCEGACAEFPLHGTHLELTHVVLPLRLISHTHSQKASPVILSARGELLEVRPVSCRAQPGVVLLTMHART